MIISGCELYEFDARLSRPVPGTNVTTRRGVYVRLIGNDGSDAYGEIAPLPGFSVETLDDATRQARQLAGQISDLPLRADLLEKAAPDSKYYSPSVICGFELALWKLQKFSARAGMEHGDNTADWWLPVRRSRIDICALLSGSPQEVVDQALRRVRQGYKSFKLKVGKIEPEQDVSLIRHVSEIIGPQSRLRLDANRAWNNDQAEYIFRFTSDIDLEFVEEPLRNPKGYHRLAAAVSVSVALDESTNEVLCDAASSNDITANDVLRNARSAENFPWLRALILKPMIRGGLRKSMSLAHDACRLGIEPVISSSFETRTGLEGLLLFAGSLPGNGLAAGLDTLHYFRYESEIEHRPFLHVETVENRPPPTTVSLNRIL